MNGKERSVSMKTISSFIIAILFFSSSIYAQGLKFVSAGDKPAFTSMEVLGSKNSKGTLISKYDKNGLVGSYIKYSSYKAKETFKTLNGETINTGKTKIDTTKYYEVIRNEKGIWTLTGKLIDIKTFNADSKNLPAENNNSNTLQSENNIKAKVIDYDSKSPVAEATVHLLMFKGKPDSTGFAPVEEIKMKVATSENGEFSVSNIPIGRYTIMIERKSITGVYGNSIAMAKYIDAKQVIVIVEKTSSIDLGQIYVQFTKFK
jgi:hypothetical protein